MQALKDIFKRHMMWVALGGVALPLLGILAVQYRSLAQLEWSLPVARKEFMRSYLVSIASRLEDSYRVEAERVLAVPPETFNKVKEDYRDLDKAAGHFERHQAPIARRLFISYAGAYEDGRGYVLVLFYDPTGERDFKREPGSRDWQAAHAASASWMIHSLTDSIPRSPDLTVDERDPEARIIVKPIINDSNMIVGVAGMLVDPNYMIEEAMPGTIRQSIQAAFPTDHHEAQVTLQDGAGRLLHAIQETGERRYEQVNAPLQFVFSDWRLGMGMLRMTEEQWATRLITMNTSLSVLATILLIGGILMALRTASREMKLSEMKSDFVSNVSHELRTPLASIRVFGEFLRMGRVREEQKIKEYGEYIETESRRLTQLINNILDFSRIESGRKTYSFEEADLAEIIGDTLKAYEVHLSQSGFNIEFEVPRGPLPRVLVDGDAIAQAFVNLLDNAVKYSGSARDISIRLGRKDEYVTVSVTDRGVGVPGEEREKIFEKFYRVGTGLVHDVKGSGLGLAIVKHVADAHHGLVTVSSKPGLGSTFTLLIPSHRLAEEELGSEAGGGESPSPASAQT